MLSYLFPNRTEWNNEMLPQLDNLLKKYLPNISLKYIGFPANLEGLAYEIRKENIKNI